LVAPDLGAGLLGRGDALGVAVSARRQWMVDYRAITALLFKDRSYRQIVEAVGCSHRDVSTARKIIADRGITAQRLAGMSDAKLAGLFPDRRARVSAGYDVPDFAGVAKSMRSLLRQFRRCAR